MLRFPLLPSFALVTTAAAQTNRTELKRADLTGTDMEVIVSVVEVPPGNSLDRHTHHGEEAVYVLEGPLCCYLTATSAHSQRAQRQLTCATFRTRASR